MFEYNKDQSHQNFEDYYETSDKVNVRFNLNIESIYENNNLFSSPMPLQKQSLQIQPFIQFNKNGLLKLYFKIVDFNNPSNTTIINTEVEMSTKSTNDSSLSNSDCFMREITTGSQSLDEEESSHYERAKQYSKMDENHVNILNNQYLNSNVSQQPLYINQFRSSGKDSAFTKSIPSKQQGKICTNMMSKKVKKNDEKYHQKQKNREQSGLNYQFEDESDQDDQRCSQEQRMMRNSENPYKLRKTLQSQEEIDHQQLKDDLNRLLMMNQPETSQSDILFNLYHGNTSQQLSPQTNPMNHPSRASKNDSHSDRTCLTSQQCETNQQSSMSYKSKSSYSHQLKFDALDTHYESQDECLSNSNKLRMAKQQYGQYSNCNDNSNNEYHDNSYSKQSLDQNCVDSSTVITRTRRNGSSTPQCLVQLPLLNELPKKKPSIVVQSPELMVKEEANGAACKGNAVNMAKNILKGFMEYVFVSAKEEDLIECCTNTRSTIANQQNEAVNNDENKLNMEIEGQETDKPKEQNKGEEQQQNQDDENDDGDKNEEDELKDDLLTEGDAKDQKSMIDGIRKRFKKQYNSKMLEKPSNSKLLKLFSNNNYGKLFKHYFSSEEIMSYIESSNIQNKNAHKELVEKIRGTAFDIERLQDVLKTRIFKRPPFQKPQK